METTRSTFRRVPICRPRRTKNTSGSSHTADTLLLKRKRRTLNQTAVITAATNVIRDNVGWESTPTHIELEGGAEEENMIGLGTRFRNEEGRISLWLYI
jgi:hypothetical protein